MCELSVHMSQSRRWRGQGHVLQHLRFRLLQARNGGSARGERQALQAPAQVRQSSAFHVVGIDAVRLRQRA